MYESHHLPSTNHLPIPSTVDEGPFTASRRRSSRRHKFQDQRDTAEIGRPFDTSVYAHELLVFRYVSSILTLGVSSFEDWRKSRS